MALTREELAQQTLDSARQAVDELRKNIREWCGPLTLNKDADAIDEAITGLEEFLPLGNDPLPIPPVEVPSDEQSE